MIENALTKCPNCGEETFERAITGGAGVLYKGEGWYVTDYSKKSSGGKDKDSTPITPPSTPPTSPSTPMPVASPKEPVVKPVKKAEGN